MLQSLVGHFLFVLADGNLFQVYVGSLHVGTCTVVVEQRFGCIGIFAFLVQGLYFLQSGIIQVEEREHFGFQFLGICFANEAGKCQQDDIFKSLIHNVCWFTVWLLEVFVADTFQVHEAFQSFQVIPNR